MKNKMSIQLELFDDKEFFLPKEFIGKELTFTGLTKNTPRRWTDNEIDWAVMLRNKGFRNKTIAKYLYREVISVSIKMKRIAKKNGETYNEPHRKDKYRVNDEFLNELKPFSVLDLYCGVKSYYDGKVSELCTNDKEIKFKADYNEDAEKLIHKLYYDGNKYDLIDLDSFGSAYECFDLSIKMARIGLIITLGEMGHVRWRRLDYVRSHYNINSFDNFNSKTIVDEIIKIGVRNKKKLIPVYLRDYLNISRVYFRIENIKVTEQWENNTTPIKDGKYEG